MRLSLFGSGSGDETSVLNSFVGHRDRHLQCHFHLFLLVLGLAILPITLTINVTLWCSGSSP